MFLGNTESLVSKQQWESHFLAGNNRSRGWGVHGHSDCERCSIPQKLISISSQPLGVGWRHWQGCRRAVWLYECIVLCSCPALKPQWQQHRLVGQHDYLWLSFSQSVPPQLTECLFSLNHLLITFFSCPSQLDKRLWLTGGLPGFQAVYQMSIKCKLKIKQHTWVIGVRYNKIFDR